MVSFSFLVSVCIMFLLFSLLTPDRFVLLCSSDLIVVPIVAPYDGFEKKESFPSALAMPHLSL